MLNAIRPACETNNNNISLYIIFKIKYKLLNILEL